MNATNSTSEDCRLLQGEIFSQENYIVILICIVINLVTCPVTIVMNVLVIVAVKTRQGLQRMSNILLAYLASTDLLVGVVSQPLLITALIFLMTDSFIAYCNVYNAVTLSTNLSVITSVFLLALISIDRYVAMKHVLRYESIVTKSRITVAVVCSWLTVTAYIIYAYLVTGKTQFFALSLMVAGNLSVIAYCHISVYAISRRHRRQIISQQISQAATAKFLEQKKAWKTTTIIIGVVCLSFLPGLVNNVSRIFISGGIFENRNHSLFIPVFFTCMMLNSLFNPMIYCWRIRNFREALLELLISRNN
ncbi:melanocyte-stimulating hormone receptor-like [Oculina patagonica]